MTGARLGRSPLRRSALLACAMLAVGAGSSPAAAQLGRKSWEFFPHVGLFFPGEPELLAEGYDASFLWGFYATYHYTDYVGVELGYTSGSADAPRAAIPSAAGLLSTPAPTARLPADVDIDLWQLTGFVNSGALKPVQVFADAGVGLVTLEPEGGEGGTRVLVTAGAGVRWYAWKNVALRAEAKDFVALETEVADYTRPLDVGCPPAASCPAPDASDTVHNPGVFAGVSLNF